MSRALRVFCILLMSCFAFACGNQEPRAAVARVRVFPAKVLQKKFFQLSADDDLSEAARKTFLEAALNEASGSGFVVSGHEKNGKSLFVTNGHVTRYADRPELTLDDGETFSSSHILFQDPTHDLSILEFKSSGASSSGLKLATAYNDTEEILALGYPALAKEGKFQVTTGVISDHCLHQRDLEKDGTTPNGDSCWIKHTAATDQGSSGGPIIAKSNGAVVGVTTAILGGRNSMFLAVPAEAIESALKQAEEIRERRNDKSWLTGQLKDTCRKFLDELQSSSPNYKFLQSIISNELAANEGHALYRTIMANSDFLSARMVAGAFLTDPLETFRSAIVANLKAMMAVYHGKTADERCEQVNQNDDPLNQDGNVRIMVAFQNGKKVEFVWRLDGGWKLLDYNP